MCLLLCVSAQMMIPLERVPGIMFLCFAVACTPAGQCMHCLVVFSYARPDEKAILVLALRPNISSYAYSQKKKNIYIWVDMCMQLSAYFRTSGSYQNFFSLLYIFQQLWLRKILDRNINPVALKSHQYMLVSPLCYENLLLLKKIIQRILMNFPPCYRTAFVS